MWFSLSSCQQRRRRTSAMTRRGTTLLLESLEDRLDLATIIDLGVRFGDTSSVATGINASGQVVGYSESSNGTSAHAFLYSNGSHERHPLRVRHYFLV
jgi:probable HAF family extracellular repeat protein